MGKQPLENEGPCEQHDGGRERAFDSVGGVGQCQLSLGEDLSVVVVAVDNCLVDKSAELGTEAGMDH